MPHWFSETRRWVNANKLLTIGILGTAGYAALLWPLIGHKLDKFDVLDLNEVGDFFAGVFGPLTVFWLILGYVQQGQELKQNSRALHLQAEELRNSVEQQEKLVQATFQQLELEREKVRTERAAMAEVNSPRLNFEFAGKGQLGDSVLKTCWTFNLENFGRECHDVLLELEANDELDLDGHLMQPHLAPRGSMLLMFSMAATMRDTSRPHPLLVNYTTVLGEERVAPYGVEVRGGELRIRRTGRVVTRSDAEYMAEN